MYKKDCKEIDSMWQRCRPQKNGSSKRDHEGDKVENHNGVYLSQTFGSFSARLSES